MGRRKGWFSAVKKALGSEHKEHGNQERSRKSKKKWFAKHKGPDPLRASAENDALPTIGESDVDKAVVDAPWSILDEPYAPVRDEQKLSDEDHAQSEAIGTSVAAKVEAVSPQPAEEIIWLRNVSRFAGKSKEEVAAIKIQTTFRGHMAKRTLRALRGLVRLKSLVQGPSIKRQATSTLRCMQTLSHVQSQIRARRIRMSEENLALQRQLQQKHEQEMEKMNLTIGDDWNDSTKSKEKLEESLRYRQEAAMRRERALAYAHSQQQKWRNASKTTNPAFMDPINPHWGWSWLERWMAARPWESSIALENGSRASATRPLSIEEISKAYYAQRDRHPDDSNKPLPIPQRSSTIPTRRSTSTSASKSALPSPMITKSKSSSTNRGNTNGPKKDSDSTVSSAKQRRHSVAGSLATRNNVTANKARSRLQNPSSTSEKAETGSKGSASVKRLPSSSSPAPSEAKRESESLAGKSSSTKILISKSKVKSDSSRTPVV